MAATCDRLEAFADGELAPEEAQEFTEHLGTCASCQARLTRLMQLEEFGRHYVERHGPVKAPWYAVGRRLGLAVGGAIATTVAVAVALQVAVRRPVPGEERLWARPDRSLEARVTYREADVHRPLAGRPMGGATVRGAEPLAPELEVSLKGRGEYSQLAAAYLMEENPDPGRARKVLDTPEARKQSTDVDLESDLGVADFAEREYRKALVHFNHALLKKPEHLQALWNRALVYRELRLPLLAMRDFATVERLDPDPGWREEAEEQRKRLAQVLQDKETWKKAQVAGGALSLRGAEATAEALPYTDIPSTRRDFYDAVRTRTSPAAVRDLLPLAQQLDGRAKAGNVLAEYVQRVASRDFKRRAPAARAYALVVDPSTEAQERQKAIETCLRSGEDDIAVGAMTFASGGISSHAVALSALAKSNRDPWFKLQALQARAGLAMGSDGYEEARPLLQDALGDCKRTQLTYRCLDIENDLAFTEGWLFQLDDAEEHAQEGLKVARTGKEWDKVVVFLQALGNISRIRADSVMGRAYYEEALLAADSPRESLTRLKIHQNLAHLAILDLDLQTARKDLDEALKIGPLTFPGAEALADVARTFREPGDAAALEAVLSKDLSATAGKRAYAKFLLGRFTVEEDPERGRALLEEAIHESEAADQDKLWAKHARTYSYTSLIFDDAKRGDFEGALRRFGTELGFDTPTTCVLALTEDTERSLIVAHGASGQLIHEYEARRPARLLEDMTGVVPERFVAALRPCPQVDVLARPRLQARAGLLPVEIAWRYRSRATPPSPPKNKGLYVVVTDVQYDERRQLPRLQWPPWSGGGAEVRLLQGLEATPSRVLDAIKMATEVDLATHGYSSSASRGSRLVLARDLDGSDELREDRIRHATLSGAPLVVLAACEAARGDPELHEPGGLPYAFLAAGARGVIAATTEIKDQDSARFFAAIRERLRTTNVPTSVAVRDERLEWLKNKKGTTWVPNVLVFE